MKFQAIRGRNQRGISFVSEDSDVPLGIVRISSNQESTLSVLKKFQRVPPMKVVLDKRYYDILRLNDDIDVTLEQYDEKIPYCTEFSLQVSSERMLDAKEIVQVFSKKIEDLEPYLDGLILQIGKGFLFEELGVTITPTSLKPVSRTNDAAIVDWKKVLKVYLEAGSKSSNFNLCLVIELGAASRVLDIKTNSDEAIDNVYRYEIAHDIGNLLIPRLSTKESLFYSIAFSTELSHYSKDMPIVATRNLIDEHSDWLQKSLETHNGKPSDLAAALDYAIKIARAMKRENGLPTLILLLSGGSYSYGVNPVPIVRNLLSGTEGIILACIGLGARIDVELLEAIAKEGNGFIYHMNQRSQLIQVKEQIEKCLKSEV